MGKLLEHQHRLPWTARLTLTLLAMCLFAPACSGPRQFHQHPAFVTESDAANDLNRALESPRADERREAIGRIARTRYVTRDTIVRGMTLIAQTDPSSSVRCAAIRALGKSRSPSAVESLVEIITLPDSGVAAPDDSIRWDSVQVLTDLVKSGVDVDTNGIDIRANAARLLESDPSRDVRIASAQLLGFFPHAEVLGPLIAGLEQRDFGVVYECERSLMRLTGRTHHHDPVAWKQWVQGTNEPFADAGRLDGQLDRGTGNWFQRSWDSTRQTLAAFRPKGEG